MRGRWGLRDSVCSLDERKARLKTGPHSGDLPRLGLVSLLYWLEVS